VAAFAGASEIWPRHSRSRQPDGQNAQMKSASLVVAIVILAGSILGAMYWRYGPGVAPSAMIAMSPSPAQRQSWAIPSHPDTDASAIPATMAPAQSSPSPAMTEFAGWSVIGLTVTPSAVKSPDGTLTTSALTEDSGMSTHQIIAGAAIDASKPARASLYAHPTDGRHLLLSLASGSSEIVCDVDLHSGAVVSAGVGAGQVQSCIATHETDYWSHIVLTGTINPVVSSTSAAIAIGLTPAPFLVSYPGNGTGRILIWHAAASPVAADQTSPE
jgi:hypothetical protein